VTALCKRVIIINKGTLLYDGALASLSERSAPFKLVTLDLETPEDAIKAESYGEMVSRDGVKTTLRLPRAETSGVVSRLLSELSVIDLTVSDPPIEEVIEQMFRGETPSESLLLS